MMMYHQTKFSCKRISSSDNIFKKKSYYIYIILNCDLDLKDSKMMHHHSKFGSNRLSDSENII